MDFYVLKVIKSKDEKKIGKYLVYSKMRTLGMDEFSSSLKKAKMFDYIDYKEAEKIQDFYSKRMYTEMKIVQIEIKECVE